MSTTTGPTRGAERHTAVHRWDAHPRLARALQIAVVVGPLAVSILFTWLAAQLLPPARLGVGRWTWVAMVFVAANLLLAALRVASRRLVPLIALLRLTLVFPDNAPSRMKATMRKSNSRAMFREIEAARARGDHSHEALHGEYAIQLLRDVNEHDRLTRGHSERVRAYAELLGEELGLGPRDMDKLRWGALLHDVGKLSVPSEILNLDGRPSEEQWQIIQGHPGEGGRLLEPLRPWLGDWLHAADQHHCRWDGRGYPLDLAGTDIAFAGRLVAIADAYDTMTSVRSYKKPLSPEAARTELTTAAGSQFDPMMVRAFLRIGLGRLRTVSGPLAWIVNFLGSLQVPVPAGTIVSGGFSAGIASAGLAAATVFGAGPTDTPDPQLLAFQDPVVVAVDDHVESLENQPIEIVLAGSVDGDQLVLTPAPPEHGELVIVSMTGPIEPDAPGGAPSWVMTATYTPMPGYVGRDQVTFNACTPEGPCDTGTVTIVVTRANRPPIAGDDRGSVGPDGSALIRVLDNDRDPDGDALLVAVVADPANGRVVVADGVVEYVPDPGFDGEDTFTYTVTDPDGAETTARVTVTVPVANQPPRAIDDRYTTTEDQGFTTGNVTANDTDDQPVDGSSVVVVGDVRNGLLIDNGDGTFVYAPGPDFSGTDAFAYTITDPYGQVSAPATVTIVVAAENDPPVAAPDAYRTDEDTSLTTGDVTANDTDDEDAGRLGASVTVVGSPVNGTLTAAGSGVFTYLPDADFSGTDSFTYTVTDSDGATSDPASVTISIAPINDSPVAIGDGGLDYTTPEDVPFTTGDVTANDTDPDHPVDPVSATVLDDVSHGTLLDNDDGTFTYLPDLDFNGTDAFTYTVTDPDGATSNPATVTLTISATNDAPDAFDDSGPAFATSEDTPFTTGDVTANDTDPDHPIEPATVAIVDDTSHGELIDMGNGTFSYIPHADFSGTDTFTYTVTDPVGATSNAATVTIVVDPVNDPPVANEDAGPAYTTEEDAPFTTGDVTANDTDLDHPIDPASTSVVVGVANGALTDNGDGTFDYTPDPNFVGTDAFTYRIFDAAGAPSAPATVTLTVTSVNDPPVANDDGGVGYTTTEDTPFTTGDVTANDTDVEDTIIDPSTITLVTTTTNGTLTDNDDGTFDYTPNPNFTGTDTFTYTVADTAAAVSGPAVVTLFVTGTNDAPVAADDDGLGFATDEDTPFTTGDVTANDTDVEDTTIDPSTITLVTTTTNGTLTDNGDGTFDYTPNPEFSGTDTFTYEVSDSGSLLSNQATVTIVVASVNDAPVAADDDGLGFATDEDTPFTTGDVTANDTDVDGAIDAASVAVVDDVANGTLANNGDGTFTYTPAPDFFGTDSFTYAVTDGGGAVSSPATVTISVASVNDVPVAATDTALVDEGAAVVTIDLRLNDVDDDGPGPLAITAVTDGAFGSVVDNGDGTVTYTHDGSETTSDSFSYTVSDSIDSDTASVQVEINPVNDPPVAVDDTLIVGTGATATTIDLRLNDIDPENDPLTIVAVSNGANGTVVDNGDGTVTYTHDGSLASTDAFTYTVSDSLLQTVGSVEVTISGRDHDAVDAPFDNCPDVFNLNQYDTDGDGVGDACDPSPTLPTTGTFADSGQTLGDDFSYDVAFGDLDGDGDLDLVVANYGNPNTVWINDGSGGFTDSGQLLGFGESHGVAIGDLDRDGDLDITFANTRNEPNTIWLNDGSGSFVLSPALLGVWDSTDVVMGDFDGDGDLDLVYANESNEQNRLWLNDGLGLFTLSPQVFAANDTLGVATGDLDGDGDLDLVFANDGDDDTVWLNDGTGAFIDTGQALGIGRSHGAVLADFDDDGDLDVAFAGDNEGDTLWLNDGSGTFTDSGQNLGWGHSRAIDAGDLDGDGDLDLVLGDHLKENTVWLNDGTGTFTDSLQLLTPDSTEGAALGDVDGDGDLDVAFAEDGRPSRLWLNS